MDYPEIIESPADLVKLISHKELAYFSTTNTSASNTSVTNINVSNYNYLDEIIGKENRLLLHPQQRFVRNFLNPNTNRKRVLCKHDTGTGKTNAAISVAFEFIKFFKDFPEDNSPMVFIIGFSKHVFQRELLRRPEFGFVSSKDLEEERNLRYLAETGTSRDVENLAEFESRIRKRLGKKNLGGYFKFYGYKEFYNRLFNGAKEIYSETELMESIRIGKVKVNEELVKSLANGLVICDEIHNVYNSININNYGIALRYIFNYYDANLQADSNLQASASLPVNLVVNLRVVLLSATPINNSPAEIVDLLNLLIPQSELPGRKPLLKDDIFADRKLKPGAAELIARLSRGYVSFIRNQNPKYYPQRIIKGKKIAGCPYLKFIICPMSPLQSRTYRSVVENQLPADSHSILDVVFPNPDNHNIGLYKHKEIKYAYSKAEQKWKDDNGIQTYYRDNQFVVIITNNLDKYSSKYYNMIKRLIRNLKYDKGKVLIVHQDVKGSGVQLIQEILLQNGFISEADPVDSTLCVHCGIPMKSHSVNKGNRLSKDTRLSQHIFQPARFLLVYGELDYNSRNKILEKYNHKDNINGNNYRILIGSRIMNESIDLNCVRSVYIMSMAPDIPTLLQILGRSIRNKSHIWLPSDKRHCKVFIFISTDYEEKKYREKLADYLVIQNLEKILNANAVDAPLYRSVIFPHKTSPELGTLYYDLDPLFGKKWQKLRLTDVNTETFNPYFADQEIADIIYIIKRLFLDQSTVWKYADLWKAVQSPPFDVYFDTSLIDENNFVIALHFLTFHKTVDKSLYSTNTQKLFDPDINRVFHQGKECEITLCGDYYILLPLMEHEVVSGYSYEILGIDSDILRRNVVRDPDSWYRRDGTSQDFVVNVTERMRTSNISYAQLKYRFYNQFKNTDVNAMSVSVEVYSLEFHTLLLEDVIRYVFNIYTGRSRFSELHEFYLKMLYYYDKLEMVLFAHQIAKTNIYKYYRKYVKESKEMLGYNSFLMSSINKSSGVFDIDRLNKYIGKNPSDKKFKHIRMEDLKLDVGTNYHSVIGSILPVGHFLNSSIPKIYLPDNENYPNNENRSNLWVLSEEINFGHVEEVENDIIIGYYEKSEHSMELKFKLRQPIQNIVKHDDSRMTERGTTCTTKKKESLEAICRSLGLDIDDNSIRSSCIKIKIELMHREMKARHVYKKNKSSPRVRWFYLHFERQPLI